MRASAASALAGLGDARAVEPLITALKDEYALVLVKAANALCNMGWKPEDVLKVWGNESRGKESQNLQ